MSKLDAQRAMREARYTQRVTRPAVAPSPVAPPSRSTRPAADRPAAHASDEPDRAVAGLCGHRAISGRTCTREQGHAAKSHRYA